MWVIVSAAVSADGYMDDSSPRRLVLSDEEDWQEVYRLRAGCDAILVGAQTIRNDNPALVIRDERLRRERIANGLPEAITKITVTGSGCLDPAARFFTEGADAPKIVFTGKDTPNFIFDRENTPKIVSYGKDGSETVFTGGDTLQKNLDRLADAADMQEVAVNTGANIIEVVRLPEISAKAIVENLAARGMKRLMVEGGAQIIKMFIDEDAIDEFRLAVAPIMVCEHDTGTPVMVGGDADPEQIVVSNHIATPPAMADSNVAAPLQEETPIAATSVVNSNTAPRLPYFGNLPFEQRAEKTVRNVGNMRVTEYVIHPEKS